MEIRHLEDVVTAAKARGRKRLIVAYGQDSHTIAAVNDAVEAELVDATLVGSREEIEKVCAAEGIDVNKFTIIDEGVDVKAANIAVKMIAEGEGDVLMKGLLTTDKYMRAILNKEYGLVPPKGILTHVTVVDLPNYPRLLTISDVAIIPLPDFKQKQQQIKFLAQTANALGVKCPKVAIISASEQLLPTVVSSTEAALLAKMADRGQLGNIEADGPLSLDVAMYKHIAEHKKVKGSAIAGEADCMLFPNIESGNVFFKMATNVGGGELAAMVVGSKVPCVLTSRGDSSKTKLYSIALACLSAK